MKMFISILFVAVLEVCLSIYRSNEENQCLMFDKKTTNTDFPNILIRRTEKSIENISFIIVISYIEQSLCLMFGSDGTFGRSNPLDSKISRIFYSLVYLSGDMFR